MAKKQWDIEKGMVKKTSKKKSSNKSNPVAKAKEKVSGLVNKKLKKDKKSNPVKKNKILIFFMGAGISLLGLIVIFILFIVITAPEFDPDKFYNKESTILLDANGEEFATIGEENRELVTYDELPQVLLDAIIATEDSRFFNHSGFDLPRFLKASFGQLLGNDSAGGGSTLTMQVSKNTLTSTKSDGIEGIIRKFQDIYLAVFKIEKNYTKEEIIEFYVNKEWLATGSWGVEVSSQTLFGKSVRDLNLSEAALLAGLFQAPYSYNPFVYPEKAQARRETVLYLMVQHGYITQEEAEMANAIPIESMLADQNSAGLSEYQGFIDTVVEEIKSRYKVSPYDVPMVIWTTMEVEAQDVVNQLMNGELYTFVNDKVQTAIAITDTKDGSIRAIGNGRNKTQELDYNLATMINRHPGSTAKPIMSYGPLLEYGNASTYTNFFDEEMTYSNGTRLRNADRTYLGQLTMREALSRSRNIPAVQAFQQVDDEKTAAFAHSLGIDYGEYLYESFAIGSFDGVSPLELSAAYGAFARGGYYIEPYSFTKFEYRQTGETVEYKPERVQVMSEETAYMINYILMYGTSIGVAGNVSVSGTDVASKGGTSTYDDAALKQYGIPSSASADNWVATYSPDYSMTVWYGYEKLEKGYYVDAVAGSNARRKINAAVVNKVFKTDSKFEVPSTVVKLEVEKETFPAQLPSANTPSNMRTVEVFKKGTEPTEVSDRYNTLTNPTNGKWSGTGTQITITWDKIATPTAIDATYLKTHFEKNYKQFATEYYNKRINYNNTYVGTIGYQVYLKNSNGELISLGWTSNNSYTYTLPSAAANYTFVVKSAYSIYKSNMSTGLEINASSTGGTGNTGSTGTITKISLNGNSSECVSTPTSTSELFQDMTNPLIVYSGTTDVTSLSTISRSYEKVGTSGYLSGIDKSVPGTYKINYSVTYNNDTKSTSRMVYIGGC